MWIIEVVETQVQRAPGGNGYAVRTDRLAVGEENDKCHVGVTIRGVEDARGFVRDELAVGIRALGGDIALREFPSAASDRLHALLPSFPNSYDNADNPLFVSVPRGTFFAMQRRGMPTVALSGKPVRPQAPKFVAATAAIQIEQPKAAMRAITVLPGTTHSAKLEDVPEP